MLNLFFLFGDSNAFIYFFTYYSNMLYLILQKARVVCFLTIPNLCEKYDLECNLNCGPKPKTAFLYHNFLKALNSLKLKI